MSGVNILGTLVFLGVSIISLATSTILYAQDDSEEMIPLESAIEIDEQSLLGEVDFENMLFSSYDDEYIPDASYSEVEDRMSCIKSEIPLNFNATVNSFINYFTVRNRSYTSEVFQTSAAYFPIFESHLEKHGLPDELKYLPVIESGLRPKARSRAAAVGLWQFIPSTGKIYSLRQDWYIDERMDPYLASEAACRHLKSLYKMFGDWELALAAYNCGAGNVRKAMRRSGYKKTFWEIYNYLPRETRSYVPQFVAVVYTFKYAEEHNFVFDRWQYKSPLAYETLHVDGFLNLKTLAEQLNICYEDLDMLNPAFKHSALPEGTKNYPVRIPAEAYTTFMTQREAILDSASKVGKEHIQQVAANTPGGTAGKEKIAYRVQSGDVLGTIAEKHQVRVSDIRAWNNINGNLIRVGQRLNIWVSPNTYARLNGSAGSVNTSVVPQQNVSTTGSRFHIVQPGDTLWHISKTYEGLSIEKLKQLNNLKDSKIKPGQKLVIG